MSECIKRVVGEPGSLVARDNEDVFCVQFNRRSRLSEQMHGTSQMCAVGVTSESKTLEPGLFFFFNDIVRCCLDARDFLAPSGGGDCNSAGKKRRERKSGEKKEKARRKKGGNLWQGPRL